MGLDAAGLTLAFARSGIKSDGSWPPEGVAVFEGKKKAGTLPDGVDARHLRGIVKNIAQEREGWEIAQALVHEWLLARDMALAQLDRQRDAADEEADDLGGRITLNFIKAMEARRGIGRTFWLLATADVIEEMPRGEQTAFLRLAARRVHASTPCPIASDSRRCDS
ncbi:MAG: hypothetical protein EA397_12420 [Deltaproteobacteria bacterium]|nr:MAG: hypothetical protein EA397_12420 [Deltaproteobacteria bacterium]